MKTKIIIILGALLIMVCLILIAGHIYYLNLLKTYTAAHPMDIVPPRPTHQSMEETEKQITEIARGLDKGEEQTVIISSSQIPALVELIPQLKDVKNQCTITIEDGLLVITASLPLPLGEPPRYLNGTFKVDVLMNTPGELEAKIVSGITEEGGPLPHHLLSLANTLLIPRLLDEPKVKEQTSKIQSISVKGDKLTATLSPEAKKGM